MRRLQMLVFLVAHLDVYDSVRSILSVLKTAGASLARFNLRLRLIADLPGR